MQAAQPSEEGGRNLKLAVPPKTRQTSKRKQVARKVYRIYKSWKDKHFSLNWSMITAITDDSEIRNGLYPPPGSNTSTAKGGGQKKSYWHRKIATTLFKDHDEFKEVFAADLKEKNGLAV